jgi:hypothetical protein
MNISFTNFPPFKIGLQSRPTFWPNFIFYAELLSILFPISSLLSIPTLNLNDLVDFELFISWSLFSASSFSFFQLLIQLHCELSYDHVMFFVTSNGDTYTLHFSFGDEQKIDKNTFIHSIFCGLSNHMRNMRNKLIPRT